MKKKLLIGVIALLLLIAGSVYWYFSIHKKAIIKQQLQQTILNKTDSLYRLTYDSSYVDEVAGDVSFLNVKLKVDSAVLKKFADANLDPDIIIDLEMKALHIRGLESVALLSEENVEAKTINIESPVLKFFKRNRVTKEEVKVDTSEIYSRLLGKYNFIKADSINIHNGFLAWYDNVQNKQITLQKFDASIHHFLVDSMHRYQNLAGYFLKDATLHATQFTIRDSVTGKKYSIANMDYNANTGGVSIRNIIGGDQTIKDITIAGLNTYEFIYNGIIRCSSLRLHDIDLSLRKINKTGKPDDSLAINIPDIISLIEVDTLSVTEGRLAITQGNKKTVELNGIEATMYKTRIDSNGISLRSVIGDGLFKFAVAIVRISPVSGVHNIGLTNVRYNNSVQSLSVESFRTNPNANTSGHDLFTVSTGNINIAKFNPEKFIYNKIIQCRSLRLNNLDLTMRKAANKITTADSAKVNTTDIFSFASVDTLSISNGHFGLIQENKKTIDLTGIQANLFKARIDSKNISFQNIVEEGLFNVAVGNAYVIPLTGVHTMRLDNIRYQNSTQALSVGTFAVTPTIAANNPAITGHTQQDLFTIVVKNILAEKFNPGQFIFHNFITAASLSLALDLRVFTDKFHGNNTESRIGQYPHQMLQKLKIKIDIPKVRFQNSYVQYTEKKAVTGETGTLFFSQLNGTATNFSNITKGSIKLSGDGMMMNAGKAHTDWDLPMGSTDGDFTISGNIENFDLLLLNEIAKNLVDVEILSGYLDHLAYTINGNNTASSGTVVFNYHDLKLKILKADQDKLIKNLKLLSFLANAVIKNKNTDPKPVSFTNERDATKSFFNLMWKSIFAGIKKVVSAI